MNSSSQKPPVNSFSIPPWHLLEPWQTSTWLKVDPARGLSESDVLERRAVFGLNAIPEQRVRGPLRMFFGQFADFILTPQQFRRHSRGKITCPQLRQIINGDP